MAPKVDHLFETRGVIASQRAIINKAILLLRLLLLNERQCKTLADGLGRLQVAQVEGSTGRLLNNTTLSIWQSLHAGIGGG